MKLSYWFADVLYRWRKRWLENRLIKASNKGKRLKMMNLSCKLVSLRQKHKNDIDRRVFKLRLIK